MLTRIQEHLKGVAVASIFVLMARLVAVAAGFLTTILVARWFGKEALGFVTLLTSFSAVFAMVACLGLGTFLMKEISAASDTHGPGYTRGLYVRALLIVLVTATVLLVLVLPLFNGRAPDFARAAPLPVLVLAAAAMVGHTVFQLNSQTIRGLQHILPFAVSLAAPPLTLFSIVLIAGLSVDETDPVLPSYAYMAAYVISATVALPYIFSAIAKLPAQSRDSAHDVLRAKTMLNGAWPFFLSSVAALLITDGNLILASYFIPTAELGLYSVAVKISFLAGFALTSVNMVVGPRFSKLSKNGSSAELIDFAKSSTALVFWATAPILLGLVVLGKWLIITFFGPDYLPVVPVLMILIAGQFINALTGISDAFLNMTGGHRILVIIVWTAVGVNVLLSVLLVPRFGITGSGIALASSIAIWNLTALVTIRRRTGVWLYYSPFAARKGRQA